MKVGTIRHCDNVTHAFSATMAEMFNHGQKSAPRGMEIIELLNYTLVISCPHQCMLSHPLRSVSKKYIGAEILWYLSGSLNVAEIGKYADLWNKVCDENGNVNSNYGNLLFQAPSDFEISQFEWCVKSLVEDKDSRQAVVNLNLREHKNKKTHDFPCTLTLQFLIRENQLHMIVNMRSNDFVFGFLNDFPFFSFVHQLMFDRLKNTYDSLMVGRYVHNAASMHIYERHYDLMRDACSYVGKQGQGEMFVPIRGIDIKNHMVANTRDGVIKQLYDWKHGD